jgi:hypothetical protein
MINDEEHFNTITRLIFLNDDDLFFSRPPGNIITTVGKQLLYERIQNGSWMATNELVDDFSGSMCLAADLADTIT